MYSKVYIKTVLTISEKSCDKFFHTVNARTSFKSWQMYVVPVAVSHSKRVEMGPKGIEKSKSYSWKRYSQEDFCP